MKIAIRNGITRFLVVVGIILMSITYQVTSWADEETNEKIEIPATADAIWKAIDQQMSEIDKLIKANKLTEIHSHAGAIRDLVDALPSHSTNLPPDKLSQVKSNISYVDTLAKRLDESGDANDKSATMDNFTKLQKILNAMRDNYSTFIPPVMPSHP